MRIPVLLFNVVAADDATRAMLWFEPRLAEPAAIEAPVEVITP